MFVFTTPLSIFIRRQPKKQLTQTWKSMQGASFIILQPFTLKPVKGKKKFATSTLTISLKCITVFFFANSHSIYGAMYGNSAQEVWVNYGCNRIYMTIAHLVWMTCHCGFTIPVLHPGQACLPHYTESGPDPYNTGNTLECLV